MIKELFKFVEEKTNTTWNVTSADEDEEYDGDTYHSATLGRSAIQSKQELSKSNIEVNLSIDNEFGRQLIKELESSVSLTIFEKNGASVKTIWKGLLASVKLEDFKIVLVFESLAAALKRAGLRKRFQRTCPNSLYGRGCFVDQSLYQETVLVTVVEGVSVTFETTSVFPDGYFNGGMIEDGLGNKRLIVSHTGNTVTLNRALSSLTLGDNFLYPGCNKTREDCKNKFDNLDNFSGFPFIPLKNPFNGGSLV